MPLFGRLLITCLAALALMGCKGRDFFEELSPETPESLNGIYREKSSQESITKKPTDYVEFILKDGALLYRSLDENLEVQTTLVATLRHGPGLSFELELEPNARILSEQDPRLHPLTDLFQEEAQVRVLKKGTELKLTEIRGNYRRTISWARVATLDQEDLESSTFKPLQEQAAQLRTRQLEILNHWGRNPLDLHEKVTISRTKDRQIIREVQEGAALAEEAESQLENGETGKTILRIKSLTLVSENTALINEKHPAELEFSLRRRADGTEGLYLRVISLADPEQFQATSLDGFIQLEEKSGLLWTYEQVESDRIIFRHSRYFPRGTTGLISTQPSTAPVPLKAEPEALEDTPLSPAP